ncbi:hypothetical protein Tco_0087433 [Tanacetum coccineum]
MKVTKRRMLKTMESIRSKFSTVLSSSDRKFPWVSLDNVLSVQTELVLGVLQVSRIESCSFVKWVSLHFWRWLFMKLLVTGPSTSFWYDIWLADAPLCCQFPDCLPVLELDTGD